MFFDNERSTFTFPSEFIGRVTKIVTSVEEFYITEKENLIVEDCSQRNIFKKILFSVVGM